MEPKKDFMSQVDEYRHHWKCSRVEAMKAILKKDPDSHRRYIEEANAGRDGGR